MMTLLRWRPAWVVMAKRHEMNRWVGEYLLSGEEGRR
jgi:hypothetical protein